MKKEIEAIFLTINKDSVRTKLREAGFTLQTPEYLMQRKTFDFSRIAPERNQWGRVRQEADKVTMAVKEVRGPGIHDTYEVELTVSDFDTAVAFFDACGAPEKSFQENRREVWLRNDIQATIDTWPGLKPFLEIEGPDEETVKEISSGLGFDFSQAIFGSIDLVYEKELGIPAKTITALPEITFENPPRKNAA